MQSSNTSSLYEVDLLGDDISGLFSPEFDLSFFKNLSRIDKFLSNFHQRFSSYQSNLEETTAVDNSTTSLLPNSLQNIIDVERVNEIQQTNPNDPAFYFDLYIGGYTTLATAGIGLIVNIIGICLLLHRYGLKSMFNILLVLSLIFDTIYLGFQTNRCIHTYFISLHTTPSALYYILANSGERFSCIGSVLTLIALAHSRYQAVTKPYKNRMFKLSWKKRRNQLARYLLPVVIIATCFIIPIIFEIDTEVDFHSGKKIVVPSKLRLNPYYSLFFMFSLNFILLGIIPLCSLLYFTYHIVRCLRQRLNFIESSIRGTNAQRRHSSYDQASKTLMVVICTFCSLQSLRLVANIGETILLFHKNKITDDDLQNNRGIPQSLEILATLGNILMVINASVNFLIYLSLNSPTLPRFSPIRIPFTPNTTTASPNVSYV